MADDSTNQPSPDASDRACGAQDSGAAQPDVSQAEEAIRRAEMGLEEARRLYRRARRKAVRRLRRIRQTSASDLVDHTLKLVKRYPGPSLAAALFLGFLVGRSTRR